MTSLLESPTCQSISQNQWLTTTESGERVNTNSPPCDWCCLAFCKLPVSCCSSRGGRKSKGERKKKKGKKMEEECNPPAWLRNTGWREKRDISPLLTAYPTPHTSPLPRAHHALWEMLQTSSTNWGVARRHRLQSKSESGSNLKLHAGEHKENDAQWPLCADTLETRNIWLILIN